MYEPKPLKRHEAYKVPSAIREFDSAYVQGWLDRSRKSDLCLHHYTTASGMKGIVQDKEIWCSELEYLNDEQEVKYGCDLIKGKLEDLREKYDTDTGPIQTLMSSLLMHLDGFPGNIYRVFVACFCESGDLLSQWRGYSENGGGYSLGFAFKSQSEVILNKEKSYRPDLRKVLYDRDQQEDWVEGYLGEICEIFREEAQKFPPSELEAMANSTALHIMNTLMDWVVSFKHPGFAEEEEWRLVRFLRTTGEAELQANFRVSDGLAVPYLETPLAEPRENEDGDSQRYFPLVGIRYGPTLPHKRAKLSINSLLETASQRGDLHIEPERVSVSSPEVPFRG